MNNSTLPTIRFYAVKLLITTFAIVFAAWLLQKGIHIEEPKLLTGFIVAVILTLINVFLKPVFIALTIPFTILSFGLFLLVINACMILLIDFFIDRFTVDSFWWALGFSILVSLTNSLIEGIRKRHRFGTTRNNESPDNNDDEFSDYEEVE
jgi:putative membrane protein